MEKVQKDDVGKRNFDTKKSVLSYWLNSWLTLPYYFCESEASKKNLV